MRVGRFRTSGGKRAHFGPFVRCFRACDAKRALPSRFPRSFSRLWCETYQARARSSAQASSRMPGWVRQINYEAAASVSGAPMIMRILIISRDSNRDTCIWLVPISSAISDWERCS
jgi:hypothetical protein